METGVARKPIVDMEGYVARLKGRLDPVAGWLQSIFDQVRDDPKRVVFAEGEDLTVIRAANTYLNARVRRADLGRHQDHRRREPQDERHSPPRGIRARRHADVALYGRVHGVLIQAAAARGYLKRDCHRLVINERNVFAALMVAHGYADVMVSGVTRNWTSVYQDVRRAIDPRPGRAHDWRLARHLPRPRRAYRRTSVHDMPNAEELANIAEEAVRAARKFGIEPRVAMLAYSTFGQPRGERRISCAKRSRFSTAAVSISSTTARWPPTLR